MNKRERVQSAIENAKVDRIPVALWRHFPGDDLRAEGLAEQVIAFQNKFDFDLVKVTPAASYPAEMYGAELIGANNREGTRSYLKRPVEDWRGWAKIGALDGHHPVIQRERAAMRLIRAALGKDTPVLQTIFSPLSSARNLRGDELERDLRDHPAEVKRALEQVALTTIRMALESGAGGADALFFATQMATRDRLTEEEYREFGEPYDRLVLNAVKGQFDFILLHAHGENLYFELLAKYPVQILNWHDRKTPPTLQEARGHFGGALMGGWEEWEVLAGGKPAQIRAQAEEAVRQTGGRGLILGPGCVIPIDTPEENIRAAREAAAQLT